MAEKSELQRQRERGAQADAVLNSPLVKEAFDKIESVIERGWKESRADDHEVRHNAYLMSRLLKDFKSHFEVLVRNGDHAAKELLNLNEGKDD